MLEAARRLRAVGRLGAGLDNIDTDACRERGIDVFPAPGLNAQAVAEYALAGLLMLSRGAYHSTPAVLAGVWPRAELAQGHEVSGRRLGVIGFGAIGQLLASMAGGLGLSVAAHDPYLDPGHPAWAEHSVENLGLDRLLAASDAISLHVPLNDSTRNLIDGRALAAMKPGAILINAARGGVVDEEALAVALRTGAIGVGHAGRVRRRTPGGGIGVGRRAQPDPDTPHRRADAGIQPPGLGPRRRKSGPSPEGGNRQWLN